MADPRPGDEWPEAPATAVYHDGEGWFGWQGHGWTVAGAPPRPFPFVEPPFDRATYGPPGTIWIFTLSKLVAEWANVPESPTRQLLNAAIKKLGHVGTGPIEGWRVPATPPAQPGGMWRPMRFLRTMIHAKLGPDEELVHVLNWRHSTQENAPIDRAGVVAFGNAVRTAWVEWLNAPMGNGQAPKSLLTSQLVYDEIRTACIDQDVPGAKPVWTIPSQISPIVPGVGGSNNNPPLPFEVACAMSLNTNFRGPRFRGRTYLGGFTTDVMGGLGLFDQAKIRALGESFGLGVLARVATDTDYEVHICSLKYATSAAVTGVRVGLVPDSQRRRRRSQGEAFHQAWGTAVGALP